MKDFYDFEKLYKGLKASCRNVRWKDSIVDYENNGLKNTYFLKNDILNGTYELQPYMTFKIYEPKERDIVATGIRDRQFQHSLVDNYFYDKITRSFIRDNVACLKGRGVDDFLNRLTAHLRKYYLKHGNEGWVLKCDIHHYFQSIPHSVAKSALEKRIDDPEALGFAFRVIDSYDGDYGLGLGSQLCQLIALAVLDDMDHMVKEDLKIKHYIRYMDDFVLIHHDKDYLKHCKKVIEDHLSTLGLRLNSKTKIHPIKQGIKMLHWNIFLTDTGRIVKKMERKKISKFTKHVAKVMNLEKEGKIPKGSSDFSLQSWLANANRGDTYYSRKEMLKRYKDLKRRILSDGY